MDRTAKHPRWNRLYTELTYQPMLEVCSICATTATRPISSPAAARISCASMRERVYGIPPEQVVGTAGGTKYGYDKAGKPFLTKEPKMLLNDNYAGKPEGIHMRSAAARSSRSATRPATSKCWNTRRRATAPGLRCWSCTTTRRANMPTGLPKDYLIRRSGRSLRRFTTRRRRKDGSHQHEKRLEADLLLEK